MSSQRFSKKIIYEKNCGTFTQTKERKKHFQNSNLLRKRFKEMEALV